MNIVNATARRRFWTWLKALNASQAPGQPPKSAIIAALTLLVVYLAALAVLSTLR